jgi:hypothetical protein
MPPLDVGFSTDLAKSIRWRRAMIEPSSRRMEVRSGSVMRSYARNMFFVCPKNWRREVRVGRPKLVSEE